MLCKIFDQGLFQGKKIIFLKENIMGEIVFRPQGK